MRAGLAKIQQVRSIFSLLPSGGQCDGGNKHLIRSTNSNRKNSNPGLRAA